MSNRLVFSKKSKCILIFLIIIVDVILILFVTPLIDGKKFADYEGMYNYNDLFSSKTEGTDMSDIIQILLYDDCDLKEISAKNVLGDLTFEAISPLKAVPIMILYYPKNKLCSISSVTLGSVLDNWEVSDKEVFEIANATGYVVGGTLFTFRGNVYLFANIKDNIYNYNEESVSRKNSVQSTFPSNNKSIALFKVCGDSENFVEEHFSEYQAISYIKSYPSWYADFQDFPFRRVIALVGFFCQFMLAFYLIKKRNISKT